MDPRMSAAATLLFLLGPSPATGAPSASGLDPHAIPYTLAADAAFEWGCFGPCACPGLSAPLAGDFKLVPEPPDPLFEHYGVTDVNWVVHRPGGGDVAITGSGTYRVGGEFAVQHQMTLDLVIGGQPAKHFDSGLVLGGGEFPRIALVVSVHGMETCVDTAIQLRAVPATSGVPPGGSGVTSLAPNPFHESTRLEFTLRSPGPVHAVVYDVAGGAVRTLADGTGWSPGRRSLVWDGRRDGGAACAPGRYLLRLEADGRSARRSVVKL